MARVLVAFNDGTDDIYENVEAAALDIAQMLRYKVAPETIMDLDDYSIRYVPIYKVELVPVRSLQTMQLHQSIAEERCSRNSRSAADEQPDNEKSCNGTCCEKMSANK